MATYPIHIARDGYRGKNPRRSQKAYEHNQIAADLERKINEIILKQKEQVRTYFWSEIARLTGYSYEVVAELGYSIDAGSGGFTAVKAKQEDWH